MGNIPQLVMWLIAMVVMMFSDPRLQFVEWFCLAAIVIIGIPHGAADHIINQEITPGSSKSNYVGVYIATAAGVLFWWLIMPVKTGFIFIILSTFHFGQEMLEEYELTQSSLVEKLLFGSVCIILPLVHYHQNILSPINNESASYLIDYIEKFKWPFILTNILGVLVVMVIKQQKGKWSSKQILKALIGLGQILIGYWLLGFIGGFTIYFLLHHSKNSFSHQFDWLNSRIKDYSITKFLIDLVPFSALSIAGLGLTMWFFNPESFDAAFLIALVIISAVSVPHALLCNRMYDSRKII